MSFISSAEGPRARDYSNLGQQIDQPDNHRKTKSSNTTYTSEQDASIRNHFNTHGSKDWKLVANEINRTATACRTHFWSVLATPEEKAKRAIKLAYTPEEDRFLREHFNAHGSRNWKLAANKINRTPKACNAHFWCVLATPEEKANRASGATRSNFTPEEDRFLREHVNTHGPKNWKLAGKSINRSALVCRTHFWNLLATPEEKATRTTKLTYTPEEDLAIREHVNTHGLKNWKLVAKAINRKVLSCKAHFWNVLATPEEKATRATKLIYTPEEDRVLREHVNTHGPKNWKLVAKAINRKVLSCKARFWNALATPEEKASRSTRSIFTSKEDRAIREHVNTHGPKNWKLVAKAINRSVLVCRTHFWCVLATPEEKAKRAIKLTYTSEEDRLLREHFNAHGSRNWKLAANKINRTPKACNAHFWCVLATPEEKANRASGATRSNFTPEEDRFLREHVNTHGPKNWKLAGKSINRSALVCRTHFWNLLATPEEKATRTTKLTYTPEEDLAIREHVNTHGLKNWKLVAKAINRKVLSCKAHFWNVLATPEEKATRATKLIYTPEEDRVLREHVNTHGPKNWKLVAKAINRKVLSCKARFWNALATPEEKASRSTRSIFTSKEDRAIREHVNTHGPKNWKLVADRINRKARSCFDRFWCILATPEEKANRASGPIKLLYTPEQDAAIREHVNTHGPKNWKLVGDKINRTARSCFDRFRCILATPEEKASRVTKLTYTSEEDAAIRNHFNTHGSKNWKLVAAKINRTAGSCYCRFWSALASPEEKSSQKSHKSKKKRKMVPAIEVSVTSYTKFRRQVRQRIRE